MDRFKSITFEFTDCVIVDELRNSGILTIPATYISTLVSALSSAGYNLIFATEYHLGKLCTCVFAKQS